MEEYGHLENPKEETLWRHTGHCQNPKEGPGQDGGSFISIFFFHLSVFDTQSSEALIAGKAPGNPSLHLSLYRQLIWTLGPERKSLGFLFQECSCKKKERVQLY